MSESAPSGPTADRSVRVGWPADAPEIGRVQVACWRRQYRDVLPPDVLRYADPAEFADRWRASMARPPDARNRVLVALEESTVVGFAATGPSADPDADAVGDGLLAAFHVHPDHTGRGHGSRLLNAVVDTLRADGFSRATSWLFAADDALRSFLRAAGWEPDGAHRELDLDGGGEATAKQVRLHCSLLEE